MPSRLRLGPRWHHAPLDSPDPHRAAVTWLANALSHRYGMGTRTAPDHDLVDSPLAMALGVNTEWLAQTDRVSKSFIDDALTQMAR